MHYATYLSLYTASVRELETLALRVLFIAAPCVSLLLILIITVNFWTCNTAITKVAQGIKINVQLIHISVSFTIIAHTSIYQEL